MHHECPVTALRQEQFAEILIDRVPTQTWGDCVRTNKAIDNLNLFVERWIDPVISSHEPGFAISLIPPTRGTWGHDLIRRVSLQIISRRYQFDRVVSDGELS